MADLATLSLVIDTRQAVDAAPTLDKVADAAGRAEGKVRQIQTAADALIAALNRNTTATASLTGRMDQMQASGGRAADAIMRVDKAADDATAAMGALDSASAKTSTAIVGTGKAIDTATAAVTRHVAVAPRAADAIKKHSDAANENTRQVGLNSGALQNLSFQINDVATMALSGASAFQIMATQGGQLFQIVQTAGGGVKGIMTQAGEGAAALASRIGLVGAGLGALTAGFATAAIAAASYRAQEKGLINSTFGLGEASGATWSDLQRSAREASDTGKVTPSQARSVVSELNSQGNINPEVYSKAAESVGLLVNRLGKDLPEAQAAVVAGLAPNIKAFDALNRQYLLGDSNLRDWVDNQYKSTDGFKAQIVVIDLLNKKLRERQESGNFFTRGLRAIANTSMFGADPDIERAGAFFGGRVTQEEQLDRARNRVSSIEGRQRAGLPIATTELTSARADVEKLEASIAKTADSSKTAKTTLTSITVGPLVESLNPAQKRITDITALAKQMQTYLDNGGKELDKDGTAQRTVDGLKRQAEALTAEFAKGGASLAAGLQQAQFNLKTVGFSDYAKSRAGLVEADRVERERLTSANMEPAERATQIKALDDKLAAQLKLLDTQVMQAGQQQAANGGGRYSRSVSDAPASWQPIILRSAAESGQDPNFLTSLLWRESRFREGLTSPVGAKGVAQFMPGTAAEEGVDVNSVESSIMGMGRYLTKISKILGTNNEVDLAAAYNRGPGAQQRWIDSGRDPARVPKETQGYVSEVFGGRPGSTELTKEMQDRQRQLKLEAEITRMTTEAGGKDTDGLQARIEVMRQTYSAEARNQELSKEGIAQLRAEAEARAKNTAELRMSSFTQQGQWDRDQIGRSRVDQIAYSQARFATNSTDMTTPQARTVIEEVRANQGLLESKQMANEALNSFSSDLRRGATAAQAFSNVLGRIGDRALSNVFDSLVSSAFSASAGGSGAGGMLSSIGSSLGSLLGFDTGGFTGHGGRLEPAGIVHKGEYVFDAATTSRIGVTALEAMRSGARGYADGGFVGAQPSAPLPDGKRIPVAMSQPANANGGESISVNHSPTYNVTPATGVTPEQLASVMDRNNRDFAKSLPNLIKEANRRRA